VSVRNLIRVRWNMVWGLDIARRVAAMACLVLVSMLVAGAPVFAAEEGGSLVDSPTGTLFRWINFVIVAGVIAYFLAKAAGPAFRRNAADIQSAIAEGTRAREAAEKSRRAAEQKLAGLETEIAAMKVEAGKTARTEAEKILAQAQAEAEKIDQAANAEIDAAERAARLELRQWVAQRVVARAEALLHDGVTPAADGALVKGFIQGLGGGAN
jgi:F-type H+-transporting ATPase subunit b